MNKTTVQSKLIFVGVTFCLLASMTIFSSAHGAPVPSPRYGGTLRVAELGDASSLGYPPKVSSIRISRQAGPAIETLLRFDKTGKPTPWLATAFTNSVAAKTITLTLRKGVKFHDGTDFNAEAVKWNLDQCMSAKSGGTEKFKSIEVIDDYTVRINLTEWDSTITSNLAMYLGMMISPTAFKKNGEDWCVKNPIGTGPFQFVSWEKDVRTTYKKFDGYWQKGKPYLDRIEWTLIGDQLTRQFSLRKGEIDLALSLPPKDAAGLEKDGYVITSSAVGSGSWGLVPDSANPNSPWGNVKVRQAAQHAIDTEAIVQSIFYGHAVPANQWACKGHWGYNPAVVSYPYNPTKSKQLLAEAGYSNGIKTKLFYNKDFPDNDKIFTAVQGYLKGVGIDAELDPNTMARYNQIAFQGGKWEGLMMSGPSPNPDIVAPLAQRYLGGKSYSQMLVPEDFAKAIQNTINAPDFETKQKWVQEVMRLMIDKYALQIAIYAHMEFTVSQTYVHNHGFNQTTNSGLWTPEETWLER